MTPLIDIPIRSRPMAARLLRGGGYFAILVGLLVLFGWEFQVEAVKSMWPGPAMNPVTAVAFVLCGASLLLSLSSKLKKRRLVDVLAVIVALIAAAKIGQFLGWWSFAVDQLLWPNAVATQTWNGIANQIAPNTAVNFALFSASVLLSRRRKTMLSLFAQLLLVLQGITALIALLSYIYGARSLNEFGIYLPMAMPSALTFLVLVPAALCLNPDQGLMPVMTDHGDAGMITRRFLISGSLAPLFMGWITLAGFHQGYYQAVLGVSIFCVLATICFVALILWYGSTLLFLQGEREMQEMEIRDSQERFQRLSDSAFEGIIISQFGRVVDGNREFCRMFGYKLEELIGKPVINLVSPARRDMVASQIANNVEHLYETVGLRRDGSEFDLEVYARMIRLGGEDARVTALRDITARRVVDKMKDEFVSVVNHELRTPLTSIHGSLGLISGGVVAEVPTPMVPLIDIAFRNTKRLLTLIDDLLDLQKMELGHMSFSKSDIELGELIKTALQNNATLAGPSNVNLQFVPLPNLVRIHSDPARLMQVLTNLLSNAIKYSPPGGTVRVVLKSDDSVARVEVHDAGEGIPPQFYERIFRKFAQADSSTTRQKGGTGLGLSICKSIIENLGGTIGFQTTIGKGTVFFFELPLLHAIVENIRLGPESSLNSPETVLENA